MPTFLDSNGAKQLVAEVKALVDRDYKTSAEVTEDVDQLKDEVADHTEDINQLKDKVVDQKSAIEDLQALTNRKAGMLVDTASGSIASFVPDSTVPDLLGLTVDIEPVQDLHGYDSPWPAGGGVNILPFIGNNETKQGVTVSYDEAEQCYTLNGTMVSVGNFTLSLIPPSQLPISEDLSGSKYYTLSVCVVGGSMTVASGTGITFAVALFNSNASSCMRGDTTGTNLDGYLGYKQSGTPSTGNYQLLFQCWREGTVFDNLKFRVQIEIADNHVPTIWHPYENRCPISGWDSVEVEATGVNLWDEEWEVGGINPSTGGNWNTNTRIRSKNYIPIKPSTEIYISYPTSGVSCDYCFYDASKSLVSSGNSANRAITTPQNAMYIRFATYAQYGTTYNHDISINYPSTDHEYHPFAGNRYTIQLGQTVYGGTMTIAEDGSVEMLVDKAKDVYDGSADEIWQKSGTGTYVLTNTSVKGNTTSISNIYLMEKAPTSGFNIRPIGNDNFANVTAWKTFLSQNNLEVVYELATPITITITLDPVTISAISGQTNNVWSDAGDVRVEFAADIKTYIDSKIAAAVAALS